MANVTSTQILSDGVRNAVIKFEGILDTSDLGSTVVVDASALQGPPTKLCIKKAHYSIDEGLTVNLLFDATTDVRVMQLTGQGVMDGTDFGGFWNNAGTGVTGDILATTQGWAAATTLSFTVVLHCTKTDF